MKTEQFKKNLKDLREKGLSHLADGMELAYDLGYEAALFDYAKIEKTVDVTKIRV